MGHAEIIKTTMVIVSFTKWHTCSKYALVTFGPGTLGFIVAEGKVVRNGESIEERPGAISRVVWWIVCMLWAQSKASGNLLNEPASYLLLAEPARLPVSLSSYSLYAMHLIIPLHYDVITV